MEIKDSSDDQPSSIDVTKDYAEVEPKNDKQSKIDYLKSISPDVKPKKSRLPWLIIGLVLLLVVGAGAFFYSQNHKTKKVVVTTASASAIVKPSDQTVSTLKNYVSNGHDLNLSFDYPSNWTVSPPSGSNASDQTITLSSPLTTITGADGKSVTGKVVVRFRPASAGITELSAGTSTAGQASVQFAYTKPTANQFQYPYLDFIHLAGGSNPSSLFEETLITGNNKFTKDQIISDATVSVDPIITSNFYSCKTSSCTNTDAVALSINNDIWTTATLFQQTMAIFQSIQIN